MDIGVAVPAPVRHPRSIGNPGLRRRLGPVVSVGRNSCRWIVAEGETASQGFGLVTDTSQETIGPHTIHRIRVGTAGQGTGSFDRDAAGADAAVRLASVCAVGIMAAGAPQVG